MDEDAVEAALDKADRDNKRAKEELPDGPPNIFEIIKARAKELAEDRDGE